jgi:hypothetical protein
MLFALIFQSTLNEPMQEKCQCISIGHTVMPSMMQVQNLVSKEESGRGKCM